MISSRFNHQYALLVHRNIIIRNRTRCRFNLVLCHPPQSVTILLLGVVVCLAARWPTPVLQQVHHYEMCVCSANTDKQFSHIGIAFLTWVTAIKISVDVYVKYIELFHMQYNIKKKTDNDNKKHTCQMSLSFSTGNNKALKQNKKWSRPGYILNTVFFCNKLPKGFLVYKNYK